MTASSADIPIRQWIKGPAIVTLTITIIRLAGELMDLSATFFSRAGGGAGAIVGIVWLIPVFGVHFALKLLKAGHRPDGILRGFGFTLLAGLVPLATIFILSKVETGQIGIVFVCLAFFAAILVIKPAWPDLARLLWAYGLAARIPVLIVMLVAILGNWGTHYDVTSPELASLTPVVRWLLIGVFPQITFWMGFTVLVGMAFGLVTAAISGRRS